MGMLRNARYFLKTSFWGRPGLSEGNDFHNKHLWEHFANYCASEIVATASCEPIYRITRDHRIRGKDTIKLIYPVYLDAGGGRKWGGLARIYKDHLG